MPRKIPYVYVCAKCNHKEDKICNIGAHILKDHPELLTCEHQKLLEESVKVNSWHSDRYMFLVRRGFAKRLIKTDLSGC